jgi:hypothetical protein
MTASYGQNTFFIGKGEISTVEEGVRQVTTFFKGMRMALHEFENAQDALFGIGRSAKVVEIDSCVLVIERLNLGTLKDRLQSLALTLAFTDQSVDSPYELEKFTTSMKGVLSTLKPKGWKEVDSTNTLSTVSEIMNVPNDPIYGLPFMEVRQDEKCPINLKGITTNLIPSFVDIPEALVGPCDGAKDCSPSQYVLARALNRDFERALPKGYVSVALKVSQKTDMVAWELSKRYFPLTSQEPEYENKAEVPPLMAHIVARNKIAALALTIA